jgi:hypothetical protein
MLHEDGEIKKDFLVKVLLVWFRQVNKR